ncbi:2-amino-4-hydroxy-6-hydroxymethyldihydropteridine diphosphokinase [Bacillus sp. 165]|uniref:2-amino-4-hydroxy-6- hydroxymethyldihydropteridine diphosphokinase n=1 Tax=Bacillus sp. 165 TaxID=1529117 RepID=UPI001AD995C9|nr:2-amino-4-hydroxy-6-hydroxymethyldihydropteridine diphosphokinase [Bacillus sp. 165]MBO9131326.1 2-amino-4-hydroxy-6-hydroxymethyldihydropteridine diphosphokinase [Bacillus sp. 165]
MSNVAFISLGSNIGNRFDYLKQAVSLLHEQSEIFVEDISSVYETDPVGYTDQDKFLNIIIKISTSLSPDELLRITQSVECELGRKREIRWGPRTIDLDILLYNQENIETEQLIVPHPRMFERAFVLVPLIELNANVGEIKQVQIEEMQKREGVTVWKQKNGGGAFALFEN